MATKTKIKKEIHWRCKKCGDESEFYACPVVSFAVLPGCDLSATKKTVKKLRDIGNYKTARR